VKNQHIILTFSLCFLVNCASVKKEHQDSQERHRQTPTLIKKGIKRSEINQRHELQIRREATKTKGSLLVSQTINQNQSYSAHECTFGYEKGQGIVHRNQKPYFFETISVSVTARDENGDDFFDQVSYTNADYETKFSDWDFSRPFGPVNIDSTLLFGHDDINGSLNFGFTPNGEPMMELRHTDTYATARSHFFKPGEKRDFTIKLIFNSLDEDLVQLKSLELSVLSTEKDRFGNTLPSREIVNVLCSDFQEV
jgi:hypothetical protein